ncbi:hypothetical protein IWW50_004213 [Coemansia erecta]|nr:hypothetical protein IWW50_004213 [Coemansia erecta]
MSASPEKELVGAMVPADQGQAPMPPVRDTRVVPKADTETVSKTDAEVAPKAGTEAALKTVTEAAPKAGTEVTHGTDISTDGPSTLPQEQQPKAATADIKPDDAGPDDAKPGDTANDIALEAERDKEIVEEFQYLLEKSQQLFSGLSDLPEIGSKYWQPHFQRTFEVYTKLWKFQNQHRLLLEKAEHYGLKRWEVGEIASKIGQLYYRYYLRTSETNYLHEAFVFYDAIRERNYFRGEQEVKNSALMIKKLRYYARFIVVCLQMNNTGMMLQLLEEVKSLIEVYSTTFNPVDKMEWALVVKEMALFMQAVCSPVPVDEFGVTLPVGYRLVPRRSVRTDRESRFRLQEAVVVGNRPTQIKFSELTLDMYYVLQMLEREPSIGSVSGATTAAATDAAPTAVAVTAEPSSTGIADSTRSPEAMFESPSSAAAVQERGGDPGANPDTARSDSVAEVRAKDTEARAKDVEARAKDAEARAKDPATEVKAKDKAKDKNRADSAPEGKAKDRADGDLDRERDRAIRRPNPHKYVLYQPSVSQVQVYLANAFREIGDQGCVLLYVSSDGTRMDAGAAAQHGFIGGIATTRRSGDSTQDRSTEQLINTVHPADLVPFTRKPFFLLVESECSTAYRDMPNLFNQPMLSLLSPTAYPVHMSSGIYTFFLHSPLVAFCAVSQITAMDAAKWAHVERMFGEFEDCAGEMVGRHVTDANVRKFLCDDFLRQIVVRHVMCCVVLGLHAEFTGEEHLPQASPELFAELAEAPALVRWARDIIEACRVAELYRMGESVVGSPKSLVAQSQSPSSQHPLDGALPT